MPKFIVPKISGNSSYLNHNYDSIIRDWREFHPSYSEEKFQWLLRKSRNIINHYAQFCEFIGQNKAKQIISIALDCVHKAYETNPEVTLSVLAIHIKSANSALERFLTLKDGYEGKIWRNNDNLLRIRVFELLRFEGDFIQGVITKEIWILAACIDINNKRDRDPLIWSEKELKDILPSNTNLNSPLGEFLTTPPLKDIPLQDISMEARLNDIRNVKAHEKYEVTAEGKILLYLRNNSLATEVSWQQLERADWNIKNIRMFLKIFHDLIHSEYSEELIKNGHKIYYKIPADSLLLNASSYLSSYGIEVEKSEINDNAVTVNCKTKSINKALGIELLASCMSTFCLAHDTEFIHTNDSKLKVALMDHHSSNTIATLTCYINDGIMIEHSQDISFLEIEINKDEKTFVKKYKMDYNNFTFKEVPYSYKKGALNKKTG